MTTDVLVFDGVGKTFRGMRSVVTALDGVDFRAGRGRITGLIGPDGAGKTTVMRIAAGLLQADRGTVWSMDISVRDDPLAVQSTVGYMPQRFGLYEDLTVDENLALYADLKGVEGESFRQRREALMGMTALAPFADRLAGRLSGGMKQKLGLACSLLRTPPLLLLDEPTAGVDPISRRELWRIIDRLATEEDVCVLVSTAYLHEAERCHEVVLLHESRVLRQDTPARFSEELRGRCFHAAVAGPGRRGVQGRLSALPEVLDAVVENQGVRIVTREPRAPDVASLRGDTHDFSLEPVEPIFEDAYVALLKRDADDPAPTPPLAVRPRTGGGEDAMIEVRNVQKRFGSFTAVRNVSFSVARGEVFGLLGANGAGKSTTFRMLCGLLPATAGELRVAGRDLRKSTASARRELGYMAQRFSLYVNLTARENLRFFAGAYGLDRRQRRRRIAWALDTFALYEYADVDSGQLPPGYRQRLAMAAALLHEPRILFLDEPTSGVDPLARREFWQRINALADAGVTVLVTTHFMDEANYCDRLVIMADGAVLAEGSPEDLKERVRASGSPMPSMEDAFIALVEQRVPRESAA